VCVLDADPDLASGLSGREFAAAREQSLAPLRTLHLGRWRPDDEHFETRGLGLLVLDGILRRRTRLQGRMSCELLGAGDLLRPWQEHDIDAAVPTRIDWMVRQTTPLAVLDATVTSRLAAWPSILSELAGRTMRRSRAFEVRMAIAQLPSIELRVQLLFWHLADRWGRVGRDGVTLTIKPEQETIGALIGASRGRVNAALRNLTADGKLRRHPAGWLLCGECPEQLLKGRGVSASDAQTDDDILLIGTAGSSRAGALDVDRP
jgi:hypothetical protein